jgi:UDP-N-acetylglucosamine enolpyruvyl transferase
VAFLFVASKKNQMKKITLLSFFVLGALIIKAQAPNVPAEPGTSFGAKTTAENAISIDQLYAKMKTSQGATPIKLKAKVTEVCKEMGCWIKVETPKGEMTVRMKDHSFFVPLVLSGKTVVIEGIAEEKLSTVEQLRDVAEDAGKSKAEVAKITQPKKEIIVEAKGVLVL